MIARLFLLALLVFSPSAYAEDFASAYERVIAKNEIVCGMYIWPPYVEMDPTSKKWSGFHVDIVKKAFSTLDIKVVFKDLVLGTQLQDLNNGRVDAICQDSPFMMSAGKFVEFSDPLFASIVYPYVREDETRFLSRKDFNKSGVRFTSIDGDLSGDLATRLFPKAILSTMPGITDSSQLFVNVMTGKADVVICDPSAFALFEKNNPGKIKPLFTDRPLGIYKMVFSVKKGDMKMLGLLNQAVDNALTFGMVDEVLDAFDSDHKLLLRVRSPYVQ